MGLEKIKKSKKTGIIIILLMFLLLFILLIFQNPSLLWDENVYLGNAKSQIALSNFTEDFRFPLIEYLIAGIWLITGENVFIAKLLVVFLSLAGLFFFYLIMNLLFKKEKFSLLFTILFGLSNLFLFWGFRVYADMPSLTLILGSIYFAIKSQDSFQNKYKNSKKELIFIGLSGIFTALAFLARFSSILVFFSIAVYLIFNKKYKPFVFFCTISFLTIIPWLVYNYLNYNNFLWDVLEYQKAVSLWTTNEPISKEINNLIKSANFILILFIPGLFYFFKDSIFNFKKEKDKKFFFILIYFIISAIYYTFFVRLKDERYILMLLPVVFWISCNGILKVKENIGNNKKILRFFSIILVFIFALYIVANSINSYSVLFNPCSKQNALLDSINYIEQNNLLMGNETILSNYWPYYAYHFNVKAYSFWNNLEEMILDYEPKMIIVKENDGTEYNLLEINSNENVFLIKEFSDSCGNKILLFKILP